MIAPIRYTIEPARPALAKRRAGERVTLHAFRRDELMRFEVRLKRARADTCELAESAGGRRLRERWLGARRG